MIIGGWEINAGAYVGFQGRANTLAWGISCIPCDNVGINWSYMYVVNRIGKVIK